MKEEVDLIIRNAKIYTIDNNFSIINEMAIHNGKIVAMGTTNQVLDDYTSANTINAKARFIYPGFIDAHCHFLGYGLSLQQVNLSGTISFEEVIDKVVAFSKENKSDWITGRGWDQNDWKIKNFPSKEKLDSLFPNRPVFIKRIDGHAALANKKALELAKITYDSKVKGGIIEKANGSLTGILIDNAIDLIQAVIPSPTEEQYKTALINADQDCLAVGLTTVDDAGLDKNMVELINHMHQENTLKMKVYIMLNPNQENLSYFSEHGHLITEKLTVRSFKFYSDGALGSRGACLLSPYSDDPDHTGLLVNEPLYFEEMADKIYNMGFQMNTHCIGDSGNQMILNIYGKVLKRSNDLRWRIEHAQVVHEADFEKFGKYNIIPSIQATHATSDMYWAKDRLGSNRIKGAYAYKQLLKQNGMIAGGSDFPIEGINPLLGFYAAVVRKDLQGFPENGFQMENAISRKEALRAMTIWSAMANFEENAKGSLEVGKCADFVILNKDIMEEDLSDISSFKVLNTFINGEQVYKIGR